MDQTTLFFTVAGGVIVILGFIGGVMGFLMKIAADIALHKRTLETACEEVDAAHEKIRRIDPVVQNHTTDIAVLKNDIGYIRSGTDEIRDILRSRA